MKVLTLTCYLLTFLEVNADLNLWQSLSEDRPIPIQVLALDFDGTATTLKSKTFTELLNQANLQYISGSRAMRASRDEKWQLNMKEFDKKTQNILMDTLHRFQQHSSKKAGKVLLLREALASMENTRESFLNRKESFFLTGITEEGIRKIAAKSQLCPGLIQTLKHFTNNPANIISAGESKIFVESVFREYNAPKNLILHIGTLVFKNGVSTGEVSGLLSAFDKEQIMIGLINQHQKTLGYSVYVGNDYPDILAMLKADIGIVINYTSTFIRFLHALGIATAPVGDWRRTGACSNQEYIIYTAQSWYEIEEMMFGHREMQNNN